MATINDILAFTDVTLTATVYGTKKFDLDVSSFSMVFVENDIPKATLKLAVGSTPKAGGGISEAASHKFASQLERRNRVVVKVKLMGHATPDVPWPAAEFVIFDGYYNRPGYQMATGAASLTIELDHWLIDLAITSKFSYLVHAMSGQGATRPAIVQSYAGEFVGFDGTKTLYRPGVSKNISAGIQTLFRWLTGKDRISKAVASYIGLPDGNENLIKNKVARRALARFDTGWRVGVLHISKADELTSLQRLINDGIATKIADPATGNSFWETLINMSSEYYFSVIPTVYTATIAPVLKCVDSSLIQATIPASEYGQIALTGNILPQNIRVLAFYGTEDRYCAANPGQTQPNVEINDNSKPVGIYDIAKNNPDNLDLIDGQILALIAPSWLHEMQYSRLTYKNMPTSGRLGSLSSPEEDQEPDEEPPNKEKKKIEDKKVGNLLAQSMLADLMFRHRTGTITGRLSFDIAPGTPVKVEVIGKNLPFFKTGSAAVQYIYAHVVGVEVVIDGEGRQAYTRYQLSHMRTEQEQRTIKGLMLKTHPIYSTIWPGTYLLDGKFKETVPDPSGEEWGDE